MNNKGFAPIIALFVVVVIGIISAGGYYALHQKSNGKDQVSQTEEPEGATQESAATSSVSGNVEVSNDVASNPTSSSEMDALVIAANHTVSVATFNVLLHPQIGPTMVANGKDYVFLAVDLTANSKSDIKIEKLSFDCMGAACSAVTGLSVVTHDEVYSGQIEPNTFATSYLSVPRGTTKTLLLVGDLSQTGVDGQQLSWKLSGKSVTIGGAKSVIGDVKGGTFVVSGTPINQPSLTVSSESILTGQNVVFTWTGAAAANGLTNSFTVSCVSGVTFYDVTAQASFSCGDVDRQVAIAGSYTIRVTSTNKTPVKAVFSLGYGNGQSLTKTTTINFAQTGEEWRDEQRVVGVNTLKSYVDLYLASHSSFPLCEPGKAYRSTEGTTAMNGTGWLPIDFTAIPGGAPTSSLPRTDNTSSLDFYIFGCNADKVRYEIATGLESQTYKTTYGHGSYVYAVGTDLIIFH